MITKKITTLFMLFIFLCSFSSAQEYSEEQTSEYGGEGELDIDYQNPSDYMTLTGEDWENIDWNSVDYSMLINSGNPEMYARTEFYQNIPNHEYQNLDYSQVEFTVMDWSTELPEEFHSSLAGDQQGLNRYCQDIGNGCSMTVQQGNMADNIRFDGDGVSLKNAKPKQNIPDLNGLPSGAGIEVKNGKINIIIPKDADGVISVDKNTFPPGTQATINIGEGGLTVTPPGGEDVNIGGADEIRLDDGEFIIPAGETVTVNGLEINANEDVTLYGVGTGSDSDYFRTLERNGRLDDIFNNNKFSRGNNIFTTGDSLVMNGVGGDFQNPPYSVTFTEDNPYLEIDSASEGFLGFGSKEYNDNLVISPSGGGVIIDPDSETDGLPNVMTTSGVTIDNGVREINTVEGNNGEVLVFSKADIRQGSGTTLSESVEMNLGLGIPPKGDGVTINEGNTINFGNDVQYANVEIDPHHVLPHDVETPESRISGVYIDSNLDAQADNVQVIIMTPPHDETDEFFYDAALDVILENVPPGTYPLVLDLSETEEGNSNFIDTNRDVLESLNDQSGLGKLPATVVGHSGQGLKYDENGQMVSTLTVSAGVKNGEDVLVEMDRDVSLGCSTVNQIVSDHRTEMINYLNGDLTEKQMEEYDFLFGDHDIKNLQRGYGGLDSSGKYCKNGDYCIQGDSIAYKDDATRREMNQFLQDYMIAESPYDELYKIEMDNAGNIISGMRTSDLPIYAAMNMERNKPGNADKSEQELLYAMRSGSGFKFPDCYSKNRAEALYQEAYGETIKYAPRSC